MKTVDDIFQYLCELAPLELQMDFDNAGLLVGYRNAAVSRAMLALDITEEVIREAAETDAQLIISHHPVIFHPTRSLTDRAGEAIGLHLIENGLAAICMHTNLDIAPGGVNDVLMELLGANVEGPLDPDNCGRVGTLPEESSMQDFLSLCKERLKANGLRYYDAGHPVKHLAVMGGAGGDSIRHAVEKGCDTYVTADLKYHSFLDAAELGLNLIDADHFCTENPVIGVLAEKLSLRFPDVKFVVSQRHQQVISFF